MKGVQCYELFGGIALKIHTFSFSCMRSQHTEVKKRLLRSFHQNKKTNVSFKLPALKLREKNVLLKLASRNV